MRECLSCKKPIPESRRQNAMYCDLPACRAREYRRRKRETAKTISPEQGPVIPAHARQESMVITCSCGKRLLIQVSHLGSTELQEVNGVSDQASQATHQEPVRSDATVSEFTSEAVVLQSGELAQESVTRNGTQQKEESQAAVSNTPTLPTGVWIGTPPKYIIEKESSDIRGSGVRSESTESHRAESTEESPRQDGDTMPSKTPDGLGNSSAQGAQAHPTNPTPVLEPRSYDGHHGIGRDIIRSPAVTSPDALTTTPMDMERIRTCELYGVIGGAVVPLSRVLRQRAHGSAIELVPGAALRATMQPEDGFGLAGTPGRWRDFYEQQSPTQFGLAAELGVMFWDEERGRGSVLTSDMLANLLGWPWRERLRRISR